MNRCRNNKTNNLSGAVFALTFFILTALTGCTGTIYKTPSAAGPSATSGEEYVSDTGEIIPESEVFDLEPNIPGVQTTDEKQLAYMHYMLSTINISNGDYREAIENLKRVIAYDPGSGYLKKRMALLLNEVNNTGLALKYAEESLRINPDDIGTKLLLAELYGSKGDNEASIAQYKEILAAESDNERVRMMFATALARAGMLDDAMSQLNILTDKNPDLYFACYYKGRIYQAMKKYDMAENEYKQALSINEGMEPALFDLAGLYYIQGRLEDAANTYRELLNMYPLNRLARERLIGLYELLGKKDDISMMMEEITLQSSPGDPRRQAVGLFYLQEGKLDEAIKELDAIVSAWPGDQKSRYYLALAYEGNDAREEALYHFRLIDETSEYYINSRLHVAYLLKKLGKTNEAIDILRRGIEFKKDEMDLYTLLASMYESENDFTKAGEILKKGLALDEENIEIRYRMGVLLEKEGKREDSLVQMKKIIELDPNHADALNYIGYSYAERGTNLSDALEMIQKAIKIKPDNGYYIDSLGWVYYQQGNYDNALISLQKAFSLVPGGDPTIAEHLGDVYLKINKYEKSIEMYEKALSLNHQSSEKILKKIEEVKRLLK